MLVMKLLIMQFSPASYYFIPLCYSLMIRTEFHECRNCSKIFFPTPLWPYSPILGIGRLHETFRFITVTRSRIVSSTPWMGDQLIAWTLLTAPCDCDDNGEVDGMNGFGRENRSTLSNPAPMALCPPQIPLPRPGPPQWEASD
jgi:hypothetical protein